MPDGLNVLCDQRAGWIGLLVGEGNRNEEVDGNVQRNECVIHPGRVISRIGGISGREEHIGTQLVVDDSTGNRYRGDRFESTERGFHGTRKSLPIECLILCFKLLFQLYILGTCNRLIYLRRRRGIVY